MYKYPYRKYCNFTKLKLLYFQNNTFMKKIIFLCFILFPNKGLIASVNNNPFEYFSLSIELLKNVKNNDLHYFYQSQDGIKASFSSPFYWVNIRASVQIVPFFGLEKDYIDFIGIHPNIKCGKSFRIFEKLRWYNAIGTGYYIFYFSKPLYLSDEIYHPGIAESELSAGFLSELQYSFNDKIYMNIGTNIDRIFTYKNIDMINISMGISYLFKTPDWMILLLI